MKQLVSLALCASLVSACAAGPQLSRQAGVRTTAGSEAQTAVGEFARSLAPGSRVSVTLDGGRRLRGTLMKVTDDNLVMQPRARVPEPPAEIPLAQVRALELDQPQSGNSWARAATIGAAVGVGTMLGMWMLFAALYNGD
jgi:hypothetical protein